MTLKNTFFGDDYLIKILKGKVVKPLGVLITDLLRLRVFSMKMRNEQAAVEF